LHNYKKVLGITLVVAIAGTIGAFLLAAPTPPEVEPSEDASTSDAAPEEAAPTPKPEAPKAQAQHILFIVLDTVRADHLSVYGYPKPTSPVLEKFSRQATKFKRARAVAPWTLPSHASMFTGLYPFEHGARTVPASNQFLARTNNVAPLDVDIPTLPAVLADSGYTTSAIVANRVYLRKEYGLDRGFGSYQIVEGDVSVVNERVHSWTRKHQHESFFLFINYMDAHRPYNCTPREGFEDHGGPQASSKLFEELYPLILGKKTVPEDKLAALVETYDTALANLDAGLGELFSDLKRLGIYDEALIVITSDHGEYLGEHDYLGHSKDVYDTVLNIPLLIKAPNQTEKISDEHYVSHVHLPGLVLEHTALRTAPDVKPLLTHWPRTSILAENYYSRTKDVQGPWGNRFQRVRTAVYDDSLKYIHSSDERHELYVPRDDPGELNNLVEERVRHMERIEELRQTLMPAERRREPLIPTAEISAEEQAALIELGYLAAEPAMKSPE
jgi:arylsulfatase A-like enzyme